MDPTTGPVNDDQPQSSEWSPESPPADPPPPAPWAALSSSTSPAPEDPSLAWPMPPGGFATIAPPPPRPVSAAKHRAILISVIGGAAVLVLGLIGVHQFFNQAGTTKNFVLVSPAPASVAGFDQDVAAESLPGFKTAMASFQRLYGANAHIAGSVIAIYQGQATDPNLSAVSNIVVYLGFKLRGNADTTDLIDGAVRGYGRHLTHPTPVPVGGGVGDTKFACVTGDGKGVPGEPGQLTACIWATDRTLGALIRQGPDPGAKKLSALMLKMWPKLLHH